MVQRVVDGDTIVLADGRKIRYIGIDTPEANDPREAVRRWAQGATAVNRELVEGRKVRLEFDRDRADKYGRVLAYVHVDGTFVNAELVRRGFADVLFVPPNDRYLEVFESLREEAKRELRGAWAGGEFPERIRD